MFLPWKCGSTTCEKRFAKYNESTYPIGNYFSEILNKISHKHIRLLDFQKLPESNLDYYKISWVRNPYDRLYSGFLQKHWRVVVRKDQLDASDAKYVLQGWDSWLEDFAVPHYIKYGDESNRGSVCCHNWTHLNGKKYVDYIGKVENMNSETEKICDHLGIEVDLNKTGNVKTKFKKVDPLNMNISDYKYIDKYAERQIKLVNQVYAKDFELFGYKTL